MTDTTEHPPVEALSSPLGVIDAFVDGERVDAQALKAALATAEGRDYLVDLAAMREMVTGAAPAATPPAASRRSLWPVLLAAASLCAMVGAGSYAMGRRAAGHDMTAAVAAPVNRAPEPVREIAPSSTTWTDTTGGF